MANSLAWHHVAPWKRVLSASVGVALQLEELVELSELRAIRAVCAVRTFNVLGLIYGESGFQTESDCLSHKSHFVILSSIFARDENPRAFETHADSSVDAGGGCYNPCTCTVLG